MKLRCLAVLTFAAAVTASAQLPPGTHSAGDTSKQNDINARINAAETALEKGDFPAAEKLLRDLAHDRSKDAHILYDLGFAEEHNGQIPDAAENYAAAIAAAPDLPEPQVALGLLEARRNHLDAAHTQLTAVTKLSSAPPELRARALRALAQLDAPKDPSTASSELLAAIDLTGTEPGDDALSAQLAEHAGDTAAAEHEYLKALTADPGNIDARVGLGHTLKLEGKLADAQSTLEAGLSDHGDDTRLVAELATVYVAEGNDEKAIPLVEALRARDPDAAADPSITALLAQMDEMSKRLPQAESLDRQLLASRPDDPDTLDALGGVLVKEQKYAEAEQMLTQALSLRAAFHDDAAWAEAAGHLAFAASRAGHPEVTLQALAARATVLPNSPAVLFLGATAHDSLHQRKQAIESYKAFLATAGGKFPDEEFKARHRLVALEHESGK
jgi:Tfp pilus assembly protein PilF